MISELLLTVTVALLAYLYFFAKSRYSFFKDKGLRNISVVPLFGNTLRIALMLKHMMYVFDDIYKAFPTERIVGFFSFFTPYYLLRDPELIKQITVKDFDNFVDHRGIFFDNNEILNSNLFFLEGEKWRDMRSTLSPAFTGFKMRNMCPFMVECGHQVVDYLKREVAKQSFNKAVSLEIEMKDLFTRFATDVIANSAFGCKTNSLLNKKNEFFETGKKMNNFTVWRFIKINIIMVLPKIASMLGIGIIDRDITKFFQNIYTNTIKYRQENNIVRPDMINILIEVKEGSLKYESLTTSDDIGFATVEESDIGKRQSKRVWTDNELISQAFLFFFAGFDNISTALCFTSMELAANPEIQEKLRKEVDANYPENGNLTYESIQKLNYLDMVVSECLRLWAPVPVLDRKCVKTYNIPDKDGEKTGILIEKGQVCMIAVRSIHHDPLYWEEPEKFDPERFSTENRLKIQPFTYMPFGLGPRNCIGSRFALMELKVILFYLIRNFKFAAYSKTMNPIILPGNAFLVNLPKGFWIKIIPREIR